jgi:Ser/Thr protein kinase RdoA (MazF antagonist)
MLREVLRAYGIEGLRPRRVGAGNNNEHWFAGRHVLRRYRDGRQPDTVVYEHTILDHLQALGWPVAVPLAARDGARILNLGDQLYALFPRLPGRRGIPDRPRESRELGRMLARLHCDLATCGFDRPAPHFTAILDLTTTTWGTGTHTIDELIEGMAVDAPEYAASCLRLSRRWKAR